MVQNEIDFFKFADLLLLSSHFLALLSLFSCFQPPFVVLRNLHPCTGHFLSCDSIVSSTMVAITVKSRSRSIKDFETDLVAKNNVSVLVDQLSEKNKIKANRLRITTLDDKGKHVPLNKETSFGANGISGKTATLYVKDLGPQLGWRTVYILEYLGPLIFHPLWYLLAPKIWGDFHYTQTQTFALILATLHFIKREYETIYVHHFSNDTMPAFNLFKNSSHYWFLSGTNIALSIYHPKVQSKETWKRFLLHVNDHNPPMVYALALIWLLAESSNYVAHQTLSKLRLEPGATKRYTIPFGFGFTWVSCPHYFFESVSWLAYALLAGNWTTWVFWAVATGQMYLWAVQRHKKYLRTFGDEYKKLRRKIIVPGLI